MIKGVVVLGRRRKVSKESKGKKGEKVTLKK